MAHSFFWGKKLNMEFINTATCNDKKLGQLLSFPLVRNLSCQLRLQPFTEEGFRTSRNDKYDLMWLY